LPDQQPSESKKTDGNDPAPSDLGERQVQPHGDDKPKPSSDGEGRSHEDQRPTYKTLWREIRIIDVINCFVGGAMLIVAIAAYRVASDTSDIKTAISNLSELANQTKRQADAMSDQLGAIREQVTTLKEQAAETKLQTEAISQQTAAIKASSDANIKSALAQQKMAEVATQAQKPDVDLFELTISGLNSEPDINGSVTVVLVWRFRNTGGSALTAKNVRWGALIGNVLPEQMPDGATTDGGGIVVVNSIASAFSLKDPIKLSVPKTQADAVMNGSLKALFFARFEYWDTLHAEHAKCFGRQFIVQNGSSSFATPSGGPAYQCAN
jgi:hypothetical protein